MTHTIEYERGKRTLTKSVELVRTGSRVSGFTVSGVGNRSIHWTVSPMGKISRVSAGKEVVMGELIDILTDHTGLLDWGY